MKSENQVIMWYKGPIKIEKPLQCLSPFSYSVSERNILQIALFSIFFGFIFSVPSKVITIVIKFMILGMDMIILGPFQHSF